MKHFSLLLILILFTFESAKSDDFEKDFEKYKKDYKKTYRNKFAENIAKKQYKNCTDRIKKYNKQKHLSYKLCPNQFCEQNPNSVNDVNFISPPLLSNRAITYTNPSIYPSGPVSVDWRESGCITPVKDESFYCGSCYAFSAVAALEFYWCFKNNISITMSEQMIIDCTKGYMGNTGCNGGSQGASWTYLQMVSGGIESDKTYPFIQTKPNVTQKCKYNRSRAVATAIGFSRIRSNDHELIKNVIAAVGPVTASMNGAWPTFWYYSSGVYNDPDCQPSMSHSVLIVGYGIDDSYDPPLPYWLCKNSWSTDFGMNGYFKILRGNNTCGIENYLLYPTVPSLVDYKKKF